MQRVLFVIRTKLGDSLTTYASVRAFADLHPDWQTVLLIRKDYARLLEGEEGIRLIPFGSRLEMVARLIYERLMRPSYDVIAVAWGQGPPVRWIARIIRARRRVHFQGRHTDLYPDPPRLTERPDLFDSGWGVARVVADDIPKPALLRVPALMRRYATKVRKEEVIGVVPFADELRKNFDSASLAELLKDLRRRRPEARLRVFFNPRDEGSAEVQKVVLPANAELRPFKDLRHLVEEYLELSSWIGTDTGLFHLAAAMGIPSVVFFGPTQPWKIVRPQQPDTSTVRLKVLGDRHCDVLTCKNAVCLHQALATWSRAEFEVRLSETPEACPLREHSRDALAAIAIKEGPRSA